MNIVEFPKESGMNAELYKLIDTMPDDIAKEYTAIGIFVDYLLKTSTLEEAVEWVSKMHDQFNGDEQ